MTLITVLAFLSGATSFRSASQKAIQVMNVHLKDCSVACLIDWVEHGFFKANSEKLDI